MGACQHCLTPVGAPPRGFGAQVFEEAGCFSCAPGKALRPALCAPEEMTFGCRRALFLPGKQNGTVPLLHLL